MTYISFTFALYKISHQVSKKKKVSIFAYDNSKYVANNVTIKYDHSAHSISQRVQTSSLKLFPKPERENSG